MIEFYLVDVKNINSDIPRSNFGESDLENLADMILESGGIIKPLILKATGVETYTVIDGHFEYYAAVRAREKEPRKGEMVNAFVISPKEEDIIVKQISAITGVENAAKPVTTTTETTNSESSRLANIELRFEKYINEFRTEQVQEIQKLKNNLKEIDSKQINIQDKLEALTDKVGEVVKSVKQIEDFIINLQGNAPKEISQTSNLLIDISKMTVPQLRQKAKEKNIKGYSKMKRDDLITTLKKDNAT